MGLNSPSYLIKVIVHLTFLVITYFALESVNYGKILRKELVGRALLLHTLLSIGLSYLVSRFFLTILFKLYI